MFFLFGSFSWNHCCLMENLFLDFTSRKLLKYFPTIFILDQILLIQNFISPWYMVSRNLFKPNPCLCDNFIIFHALVLFHGSFHAPRSCYVSSFSCLYYIPIREINHTFHFFFCNIFFCILFALLFQNLQQRLWYRLLDQRLNYLI